MFSETFEYDKTHPKGLDTLTGDDFKPCHYDIPVAKERSLSQTRHKYEQVNAMSCIGMADDISLDSKQILDRRRSSVSSRKHQFRAATGSFCNGQVNFLNDLSINEREEMLSSSNSVFH